mgnify:CR=1 FL=1
MSFGLYFTFRHWCTYISFKDVISMDIKKNKEIDENQNQIMKKNRKVYEHQRKSHDQLEDYHSYAYLCCCAPILCPSVAASCSSGCDYICECKCCDRCCNCGSGGSCPLCSDEVCDLLCCIFCCPCMILG